MFRWSTFKPGKMWAYTDPANSLLGGFVIKETKDSPYRSIVPVSISSRPSRSKGYLPVEGLGGLYYNHKILGASETLEGAKELVENHVNQSTTKPKPDSTVPKLFGKR